MAIDIIARGMIEDSNSDISQLSEKVNNHTDDSDIHVTVSDKESWNSHPNDVQASGNPVIMDNLQGGVPFSEMTVSGKNLLNYRISVLPPGITVTTLGDGSLKVSGKMEHKSEWGINLIAKNPLPKGKTYTLSVNPDVIGILPINIYYIGAATENNTFVWDRDDDFTISLNIQPNVDYDFVFRPQLELGDTATEYEPPITGRELTVNVNGTDYTITPDSNPYVIPNDIRQQEGLNVVSVSEGELSVTGVRKNAAVKKIWSNMGMDLLFDGVTSADNPAFIDIKDYSIIVVSVASKYSDDIINTGTIIMAVSDIIKSISVGIKRYFSTGARAAVINITSTINNCAIVVAPFNTGDTILNCKIYGIK